MSAARVLPAGSARTPRVSVVMPAYNRAGEIGEALESVLAQDFEDFEVVVVDDGSTDDTAAIAAKFGPAVQVLRQPNGGVSAARNTGLKATRGELIAYCDADDVQFPFRLALQAAALDRFPQAGLLAADFSTWIDGQVTARSHLRSRWLGPSTRPLDQDLRRVFAEVHRGTSLGLPLPAQEPEVDLYFGRAEALVALLHCTWGCAMMFRRRAAARVGDHVPNLRAYDDWYLASKISRQQPLLFLDLPVCKYRWHGEQLTGRPRLNAESYLWVIENVWAADRAFAGTHPALVQKLLGTAHHDLGRISAREGKWAEAEAHHRQAIRHWPPLRRAWANLALSALHHRAPSLATLEPLRRLPAQL